MKTRPRLPLLTRLFLAAAVAAPLIISGVCRAEEKTSDNDQRLKQMLKRRPEADANKDGILTEAEVREFVAKQRPNRPEPPKPDFADVQYGPNPKMLMDVYLAKSDKPAPVVVHVHGGGFIGGDKREAAGLASQFTRAGISVASINYRMLPEFRFPAPMQDGARAIQFIRSKAAEWNIDPARIGASGGSAGAAISLWIAFHDDLADPKSGDPVARQSTRITCAAVSAAQTSYDPRFADELGLPQLKQHPSISAIFGITKLGEYTPEAVKIMEDTAPINHLTAGDPPVLLRYGQGTDGKDQIHHPNFGMALKKKADPLEVECIVQYPGNPDPAGDPRGGESFLDFLKRHFGMTSEAR